MATNSYTKYYSLFNKKAFLAQVEEFTSWIGYLVDKRLKTKIIKEYLAKLQLLYLKYILNKIELKVYSHPILQK